MEVYLVHAMVALLILAEGGKTSLAMTPRELEEFESGDRIGMLSVGSMLG